MTDEIDTGQALAAMFGTTVRQVQLLASQGVIPKPARGVYDVGACVTAYIAHLRESAMLTNANGVADFLGVTSAAVYTMTKEGMPRLKRGKYNLVDAVRWYIAKWKAKVEGGESLDIHEERKGLIIEQRRRTKLDADRIERRQIPVDEVGEDLMKLGGMFVAHLNALPGRKANELANAEDPAEVRQILVGECRTIRSDIAEQVRKYAAGFDPAPVPDRRRAARKNAR